MSNNDNTIWIKLPSNSKDKDKGGQYDICHTEKQLTAYFIDRHAFLPRDGLPDSELKERIERKQNEDEEFFSSTG